MQTAHHLFKGRYLAYAKPPLTSLGRIMMLVGFIDQERRKAVKEYLKSLIFLPNGE